MPAILRYLFLVLGTLMKQVAAVDQVINSDECGRAPVSPRIVNGRMAEKAMFPWMVSLEIKISDISISCAGAILTKYTVISAAHCTYMDTHPVQKIIVYYGSTLKHRGKRVRVKHLLRHPQFNLTNYHNDICLLMLNDPIEYSDVAKPICLSLSPVDIHQKNVRVSGWGRLSSGGDPAVKLYYTSLTVMPTNICVQKFGGYQYDKELMFCAYGGQTDACEGDSGAPVVSLAEDGRFLIVGIVSYGIDCAVDGRPAVYTRISTFVPWILENVGKLSGYTPL